MTDAVIHPTSRRRSFGGQVVEAGLARAGFDTSQVPDLALVETERPRRAPYKVVLAQNAWNVVDPATFRQLLRRYPRAQQARHVARRAVARANLRRAGRVVVLTNAMGELCRRVTDRVEVAPLTAPADLGDTAPGDRTTLPEGTVLVPGTVTWYKDPGAALGLLGLLRESGVAVSEVLLAGGDDGSGCLEEIRRASARAGVPVQHRVVDRGDMLAACRLASAVIVPSRLESLGFSLAEALLLAPVVVASDLPAHREIAARLGREPHWIGSAGPVVASELPPPDPKARTAEWLRLGEALGLTASDARPVPDDEEPTTP